MENGVASCVRPELHRNVEAELALQVVDRADLTSGPLQAGRAPSALQAPRPLASELRVRAPARHV